MSVINQMLKELDQRKMANNTGPAVLLPVSKYADTEKSMVFKVVAMGLFIISIVVISISGYRYMMQEMTASTIDTKATAVPAAEHTAKSEKEIVAEPELIVEQEINKIPPNTAMQIEATEITPSEADTTEVREEKATEVTTHKFVKSKVEVDLKTQVEQLYQSARREIDASRLNAAHQLLTKAVQINPAYHKARVLLLSLLLQQNKQDQMQQQLNESLQQWPEVHEYRQLHARLLIETGEQAEALAVLQQSIPTVKDAPDYHALLAYVAQQLSNDQLATKHYQLLLQQQPSRADWWLGMAVSEERLGNNEVALQAYRQSVGRPGLSQSVREYARQRIKVLQGF